MTYPEPQSSIAALQPAETRETSRVTFSSARGVSLEVQCFAQIGWGIEVRYDLCCEEGYRQPFTGQQATASVLPLELQQRDQVMIVSTAEGERFEIACADGAFSLFRPTKDGGEACWFRSSASPFCAHDAPVSLYEGLMSLKQTDFSERSPTLGPGAKYQSRMVRFRYPRPEGTVLGLPGQNGEFNRNGYRFELYNTDEFLHTPARRPMYQSWPILLHRDAAQHEWVALFHDNPSRTFVDLGDFYPDEVTFESSHGNTRLYLLRGATLEEVSTKLQRLLGRSVFPPAWAFGYQQCRWSYMSTEEARQVVQRMRAAEVPCDALYFDIDHMDGFRVFTKDPNGFADLERCVADVHDAGMHAVCIVDPGVKIDADYAAYRAVVESGAYLRNAQGEPFVVKVWAGESVLPDFGDERAQRTWGALQQEWLEQTKFDGIWNDMNEPSNFDGQNSTTAKARSSRGPVTLDYNLYGYHMARASAGGWQAYAPHRRPLVITRSGYPGVQQHAVIWHGDNQAWWEHLRLALDTCVQYSLAGALYTGPDVPGFTGNPPDDLAVRFYQLGALLPLFRGHSIWFAKNKEPYAFRGRTRELITAAIELRYSLLREWYSQYERAWRERRPLMTPIEGPEGKMVRDQFLLFGTLLAAPIVERDQTRKLVYLPVGRWYPLGTDEPIEGGRWLELAVRDESVPLFVREGVVLTRNTVRHNAEQTLRAAERCEVYPDREGNAEGYWFDDDLRSVASHRSRMRLVVRGGGPVERVPLDAE